VYLSFATSSGVSAFAAEVTLAPSFVNSLDDLKSPKYEEICKDVW
jgi:hypothetical protein